MSNKRHYNGNYLGKSELAELGGISLKVLKTDLSPIKESLPYFFSRKKTVPPIEAYIIIRHLGLCGDGV